MGSRRLVTSPAFQFYPQDYLVGTQGMSLAAQGLYMRVICFGWLKGPLTFDLDALAKLAGCLRAELDAVWHEVKPKLRETKRGFVNKRVEIQRGELRRFRESRKKAALTRWSHVQQKPAQSLAPITSNPHHKPTNLINGASLRRHGTHAWCSLSAGRDGLCVPQFLHEEFIGKSGKPEPDVKAWYLATVGALNGHAVGEDALVFWRNSFAGWVGTVTAAPDTNSRAARTVAGARKTLAALSDGSYTPSVFAKPITP